MNGRRACTAALLACALAGCGGASRSGTGATEAVTVNATAVTTACGNLAARLRGIADARGVNDPQPAALAIGKVVREMRLASKESIAANHEIEAELRRTDPTGTSIAALRRGSRRFRRYARLLTEVPPSKGEGIHLQVRLLALDTAEVKACGPSSG
jgi:uncharacterized protein YfiM (DUF2279 family)